MVASERQIFLGFAFYDQNVALLRPAKPMARYEVLATALGFSDSDRLVVNRDLDTALAPGAGSGDNATIRGDLTCSALFDQYWRTISSAPPGV